MIAASRLSLDSIVQRCPDVIAADAGSDVVMVSIERGFYYGVSEVAREIWKAVDTPKRVSEIIEFLTATYAVEESSCAQQTLAFLETLVSEKLLQIKE